MKDLFKKAHELTKKMVAEYNLKDYRTQFIICIKYLAQELKNTKVEKIEFYEMKELINLISPFLKDVKLEANVFMDYRIYLGVTYFNGRKYEKERIGFLELDASKKLKFKEDVVGKWTENEIKKGYEIEEELNKKTEYKAPVETIKLLEILKKRSENKDFSLEIIEERGKKMSYKTYNLDEAMEIEPIEIDSKYFLKSASDKFKLINSYFRAVIEQRSIKKNDCWTYVYKITDIRLQ
jgi:hypothetical protein